MRNALLRTVVSVLLIGGCGPTSDDSSDGGTGSDALLGRDQGMWYDSSGGDGGDSGMPDNCATGARLVYVVDSDGRFSSFDPQRNPPFQDIVSKLNGPAQTDWLGVKATPFSMSVDRNAIAWVLYSSGELFKVDTSNGACQATSFAKNQSGFLLMGMGFVANAPGSMEDTLYVAGGSGPGSGTNARLGTIDTNTLVLSPLAQLTGWPELTGTGLAELWGFFPDTTPPKVAKINKTTGAEEVVYPLSSLQGEPEAWAFAFWGGDFWIFLKRSTDSSTTVYRVDGTNGNLTRAFPDTGRRIVGAGVSTCAPVTID